KPGNPAARTCTSNLNSPTASAVAFWNSSRRSSPQPTFVGSSPRETGTVSGRVFKTRYIQTAYNKAIETAKLDDVNFHTLRHTFASWAVMRGVSLKRRAARAARARLAGDDDALRASRPGAPSHRGQPPGRAHSRR